MWLCAPLTFKEIKFSFPIVCKTFSFPASVIFIFPNPPLARVVLCYTRFHTMLANTFWLQGSGVCTWISNLSDFLLQINNFDPVRKVQAECKQNSLFLWLRENFPEKAYQNPRYSVKSIHWRIPWPAEYLERWGSWDINTTKCQNLMKSCQTLAKGEEMWMSHCRWHFPVCWQEQIYSSSESLPGMNTNVDLNIHLSPFSNSCIIHCHQVCCLWQLLMVFTQHHCCLDAKQELWDKTIILNKPLALTQETHVCGVCFLRRQNG